MNKPQSPGTASVDVLTEPEPVPVPVPEPAAPDGALARGPTDGNAAAVAEPATLDPVGDDGVAVGDTSQRVPFTSITVVHDNADADGEPATNDASTPDPADGGSDSEMSAPSGLDHELIAARSFEIIAMLRAECAKTRCRRRARERARRLARAKALARGEEAEREATREGAAMAAADPLAGTALAGTLGPHLVTLGVREARARVEARTAALVSADRDRREGTDAAGNITVVIDKGDDERSADEGGSEDDDAGSSDDETSGADDDDEGGGGGAGARAATLPSFGADSLGALAHLEECGAALARGAAAARRRHARHDAALALLEDDLVAAAKERRHREEEAVNWSYLLKHLLDTNSKLRRQLDAALEVAGGGNAPAPPPKHSNFRTPAAAKPKSLQPAKPPKQQQLGGWLGGSTGSSKMPVPPSAAAEHGDDGDYDDGSTSSASAWTFLFCRPLCCERALAMDGKNDDPWPDSGGPFAEGTCDAAECDSRDEGSW